MSDCYAHVYAHLATDVVCMYLNQNNKHNTERVHS